MLWLSGLMNPVMSPPLVEFSFPLLCSKCDAVSLGMPKLGRNYYFARFS